MKDHMTYTITVRMTWGGVTYSVNEWPQLVGVARGHRPDRRITGTARGPEAEELLHHLRRLLEP